MNPGWPFNGGEGWSVEDAFVVCVRVYDGDTLPRIQAELGEFEGVLFAYSKHAAACVFTCKQNADAYEEIRAQRGMLTL